MRITKKCDFITKNDICGTTDIRIEDLINAYNKLIKLENLDEQLGCSLEVLGKASNQKQIYVKKFNMYVEIRNIVIYEQATRPYIEYFYRDVNKVKVREVWIDEYKITWWLKEDKSE